MIASQADMIVVVPAVDATQALAEFRRHRPGIALMDLRLPGSDAQMR